MKSAQWRRKHNLQHKQHLNDYCNRMNKNRKNLKIAIQKYHEVDMELLKLKNAKKHGLIQIPKERKLKYKLMKHNSKTEYRTLLKHQHELEFNFHRIAYGHQPKHFKDEKK